ncbi:MAG: response regulator [Nitrospira sp.]|nr:response regulator [Nitrospira sp.]
MAILIVEDNPVNAKLLAIMLNSDGYKTLIARNGMEALATLSGKNIIELIITDYMMPEMNGLELVAKIREMPLFGAIPILIASAHSDHETVTKAKTLACEGFLTKPIDKHLLLTKVGHLVKEQPPVLRSKAENLQKLGISSEEYDDLLSMLLAQLAATLPVVILEQGDSDAPVSQSLGQLLTELEESAAILGADKFHRLYGRVKGDSLPRQSHCVVLQQVLQELEFALKACMQPSPPAEAPQ